MPEDPAIRAALAAFRAGADALAPVVHGLTPAQLDQRVAPGTWSMRELVVHVMESDLIATHRMKRVAAEDVPLLISCDETAFVNRLYGPHLDAGLACELFRLNRLQALQVLEALPDAAFARVGVHNADGRVALLELVHRYAAHVEHHLRFARGKREALGRPLTP